MCEKLLVPVKATVSASPSGISSRSLVALTHIIGIGYIMIFNNVVADPPRIKIRNDCILRSAALDIITANFKIGGTLHRQDSARAT
jgi:hypothetical protein